ncbi:uncharacterized protein TNCV_4288551 [Trichonephila clavipes]|nr:uncharacterized protein TNCV_4288551 [Trichonephila clavipes]
MLNEEFLVSDSDPVPFHFKRPSIVCSANQKRHPHETDCSLFYECRQASRFHIAFFVPHLMKCKSGTLYDVQQEQCVDANVANCGNSHKNRDPDHESKDQDHVKGNDVVIYLYLFSNDCYIENLKKLTVLLIWELR